MSLDRPRVVAGGLGSRSVTNRAPDGSLAVSRLHYEFAGWLSDGLLESTPCFIVARALAEEITLRDFSGIAFDDVEVTTSTAFHDLYGARHLPEFVWMKVSGEPGVTDFGIGSDNRLVVRSRRWRCCARLRSTTPS